VGGVTEIVGSEKKRQLRIRESGMCGFGSFLWRSSEEIGDGAREPIEQSELGQDAMGIGDSCGVGNSGTGGESGFLAEGHIGNGEGEFCGEGSGDREAAAFYGRDVLADGVDFVDGGAAGDERLIERANVVERDGFAEREFHECGAAAGNEEDDE